MVRCWRAGCSRWRRSESILASPSPCSPRYRLRPPACRRIGHAGPDDDGSQGGQAGRGTRHTPTQLASTSDEGDLSVEMARVRDWVASHYRVSSDGLEPALRGGRRGRPQPWIRPAADRRHHGGRIQLQPARSKPCRRPGLMQVMPKVSPGQARCSPRQEERPCSIPSSTSRWAPRCCTKGSAATVVCPGRCSITTARWATARCAIRAR